MEDREGKVASKGKATQAKAHGELPL